MSTKLTASVGEEDLNIPLMFQDILDFTLVDTGTDYYVDHAKAMRGVFFRSATTGTFNVLTLNQYLENGGAELKVQNPSQVTVNAVIDAAVVATKNITIQLEAGQWCDTPICWVDATNAADLSLNIGIY